MIIATLFDRKKQQVVLSVASHSQMTAAFNLSRATLKSEYAETYKAQKIDVNGITGFYGVEPSDKGNDNNMVVTLLEVKRDLEYFGRFLINIIAKDELTGQEEPACFCLMEGPFKDVADFAAEQARPLEMEGTQYDIYISELVSEANSRSPILDKPANELVC